MSHILKSIWFDHCKSLFLLQLEPRLRELIYIGYNLQLPTKDHENTADVEMVDIDILQDSAFQEDAFQFHVVHFA
jgi:hypothetical protein